MKRTVIVSTLRWPWSSSTASTRGVQIRRPPSALQLPVASNREQWNSPFEIGPRHGCEKLTAVCLLSSHLGPALPPSCHVTYPHWGRLSTLNERVASLKLHPSTLMASNALSLSPWPVDFPTYCGRLSEVWRLKLPS